MFVFFPFLFCLSRCAARRAGRPAVSFCISSHAAGGMEHSCACALLQTSNLNSESRELKFEFRTRDLKLWIITNLRTRILNPQPQNLNKSESFIKKRSNENKSRYVKQSKCLHYDNVSTYFICVKMINVAIKLAHCVIICILIFNSGELDILTITW